MGWDTFEWKFRELLSQVRLATRVYRYFGLDRSNAELFIILLKTAYPENNAIREVRRLVADGVSRP